MKAFFIGCSFTYGDDLSNPEVDAWPAIVSRAKKFNFTNYAVSGGTNDRNLYQTIKYINDFDIFYIAWTSTSRFTRYCSKNNFEVNFNPQIENSLLNKDKNFITYATLHYRYWYNQLFAFKLWLQQIVLLQNYFASNHKKWYMINTFQNQVKEWTSPWEKFNTSIKNFLCFDLMDDDQLYHEHLEIMNLVNQIDKNLFLGWGETCIKEISQDFPIGKTAHPLELGHKAIAEYILKYDTA